MTTVGDEPWRRRLVRALTGQAAPGPMLLLVAGAAGAGKSRLIGRLTALPDTRAVRRLTGTFPTPAELVVREVGSDRAMALREPIAGPTLLVVEDLHRADPAALAPLCELLERAPTGLTVVLSYRPEELPSPGLPLGRAVAYPERLSVERVAVPPLTGEQVGELVAELLGAERCPPELAARVHQVSGGVAGVVVDLLRLLADATEGRERCGLRDLAAVGVPVRTAELVLDRTSRLAAPHRPVVWAAAVLGEPVVGGELTAVAGLSGPDGEQALLAALGSAALQELPGGQYGFAVPLAAEAVYRELPGPVREALHRRAAGVLGHRQPVPWAALAAHRRGCGQVRGWLHAVEQAAKQHADAGRHQEAITLLEAAVADPAVPGPSRARLAPLLAASAVVGLRSDQTVEVLHQIVDDPTLPALTRGQIRLDLGLLLCNQMSLAGQGLAELRQAAEELAERPALAARAMSALVMPHGPDGTLAEHLVWAERADTVATASGDPVVQAAVAANRTSLLMNIGDPTAWSLLAALPRDSENVGSRQQTARGLCNAADAAVWLGHYRQTARLLTEGVELAARSGATYTRDTGRGTLLVLDWATGRWAGLAARCRAFVAETGAMPQISADARVVLGLLALARGEWGQVSRWLFEDDQPDRDETAVPLAAAAISGRIRLALARQDLDTAAKQASVAWTALRRKGVWTWAAEPAPWVVETLARTEGPAAAREAAAEFADGLAGRRAPSAEASVTWCQAVLAETGDDPAGAARLYRQAGAAYAALPRPYTAALMAEGAGRCILADGSAPDAAVVALSSAAARLDDLGAGWDAARARATLRAHHTGADDRRPPGRPSYGDRLSPREQEVAELAATGLTNREIATTLHLSPRTVEQHVARAMRKLGTQSRQGLSEVRGPAQVPHPTEPPADGDVLTG